MCDRRVKTPGTRICAVPRAFRVNGKQTQQHSPETHLQSPSSRQRTRRRARCFLDHDGTHTCHAYAPCPEETYHTLRESIRNQRMRLQALIMPIWRYSLIPCYTSCIPSPSSSRRVSGPSSAACLSSSSSRGRGTSIRNALYGSGSSASCPPTHRLCTTMRRRALQRGGHSFSISWESVCPELSLPSNIPSHDEASNIDSVPSRSYLLLLDFVIILLQIVLTTIAYETSLARDLPPDTPDPLQPEPIPRTPISPLPLDDDNSKLPESTSHDSETEYIIDLRLRTLLQRLRHPPPVPPPPQPRLSEDLLPLPNTTPFQLSQSIRRLARATTRGRASARRNEPGQGSAAERQEGRNPGRTGQDSSESRTVPGGMASDDEG